MIGDQADIAARLRRYLPRRWFGRMGDPTPVLDALLWGLAAAFSTIWALIDFARTRARLATLTGGWLDLAAVDFFGPDGLPRFAGEREDDYRTRLRKEVFRRRVTRQAIVDIVNDITGRPPVLVYEGWDAPTTGGWGRHGEMGWGVAGLWGSSNAPGEVLIVVAEPQGYGIPNVPGWGSGLGGWNIAQEPFRWMTPDDITGSGATQAEIIEAIDGVRAAQIRYLIQFKPPLGAA